MHTLRYSQKLPLSLDECWDFFSCPENLKIITPKHLEFQILNDPGHSIYPGQIIEYRIRPLLNIPVRWATEITHVRKPDYFIDKQRIGPYKMWHHEHRFEPTPGGVIVHDLVYYQLHLGFIGRAIHSIWVKNEVKEIFQYRKRKLEELFG